MRATEGGVAPIGGAMGAAAAIALAIVASLSVPAAGGAPDGKCPKGKKPPKAPRLATELNGIAWPDFCYEDRGFEEHFFIIGDWGGLYRPNDEPIPANDGKRPFNQEVDNFAQHFVAREMKNRANRSMPRYILNVGDNFYWGGLNVNCGSPTDSVLEATIPQWDAVFENIYNGPLLGLPWLGVLGNHDYGGFMFTKGWDQAIAYTWGPKDRWLTPALYWSTSVHYSDFSVDYIFADSNVNDAFNPPDEPVHNMCSLANNPANPTCGETGPVSAEDCTMWFMNLWMDQLPWIARVLNGSTADWRIVVTHFPPEYRRDDWVQLVEQYGIDLFVTGHRHQQEVSNRDPTLGNAAWVVSGGGGGITSEGSPMTDGNDDQYGFFDVTISRRQIKLEAISHTGILRSTTIIESVRPTTTATTTTATTTTKKEKEKEPKDPKDPKDEEDPTGGINPPAHDLPGDEWTNAAFGSRLSWLVSSLFATLIVVACAALADIA